MLDLKNCPFCGGKATFAKTTKGWKVECEGRWGTCTINARTHYQPTKGQAVDAWNRRATPPASAPVVRELEWGDEGGNSVAGFGITGRYILDRYRGKWTVSVPSASARPGVVALCERNAYPSLFSAKAAAQADYAQRIRSALVATPPAEPTPGQFAERVIAACRGYMNTYDVLAKEIRENMQFCMAEALRAADAVTNPVNTSTELTVLKADIDEFMRRLGPRWFLEQGWFPETVNATLASLREADHAS